MLSFGRYMTFTLPDLGACGVAILLTRGDPGRRSHTSCVGFSLAWRTLSGSALARRSSRRPARAVMLLSGTLLTAASLASSCISACLMPSSTGRPTQAPLRQLLRAALHPRFHLSGTTSPTISFTPSTGTPINYASLAVGVGDGDDASSSLDESDTCSDFTPSSAPYFSSHLETLSSPSLLPRGVRWLRSAWREILLHIEEHGGSSESSGLGGDVMRSDFTPFPAPHIPYLPARVSLVTATASPAFWLRWSCRPP